MAARWLKNLVDARHLPAGAVDDRRILDVDPDDLAGCRQCHFFAGIGGWAYALALAGWPDDREVWTGSCPCQPLSSAGQRRGHADKRHLWPAFYALIAERRPGTIFGEQVASKDGREWLAGVRADLEALGYAVGAADLCAAGVGAPHIRQRLYWVADADAARSQGRRVDAGEYAGQRPAWADGEFGRMGNAALNGIGPGQRSTKGSGFQEGTARMPGPWSNAVWLPCLDGKARRVEPGIFPLAHGVPARVGRLRAYGNAVVPQVAAAFIAACVEVMA